SLAPKQAWFLGVMAAVVIAMFAFVILPYVDRSSSPLAGEAVSAYDFEVIGGEPGARLNLSDLRGKPVVLDFWASWCGPCRDQAQEMRELHRALGDRVHLVGVATSDAKASAEGLVAEQPAPYPNVFDLDSTVARALQVTALPTLVLLDSSGTIREVLPRPASAALLEEKLESLLP